MRGVVVRGNIHDDVSMGGFTIYFEGVFLIFKRDSQVEIINSMTTYVQSKLDGGLEAVDKLEENVL